eukprot:g28697.t1
MLYDLASGLRASIAGFGFLVGICWDKAFETSYDMILTPKSTTMESIGHEYRDRCPQRMQRDRPARKKPSLIEEALWRVQRLRERITECVKDEAGVTHGGFVSVGLTRFLKATHEAVKLGPAAKLQLRPEGRTEVKAVTLPVQMDERHMHRLHDVLLPQLA